MRTSLLFIVFVVSAVFLSGVAHLSAAENGAKTGAEKTAAVMMSASGTAAAAVPAKEELTIDWMAEIIKGGLTSLALVVLSAAAVGFAAERFFHLRACYLNPPAYADFFKINAESSNWQAIADEADKHPSVIAALGAYIGANRTLEHSRLVEDLSGMAGRELERHRQRSYPLAIIATMAPMLGLLGTMIGMIEAFQKVAILGDTGDASVLADSIGKALITTAVGLVLAIPSLGCYHYLKTKISLAELTIEETVGNMVKVAENVRRQAILARKAVAVPESQEAAEIGK